MTVPPPLKETKPQTEASLSASVLKDIASLFLIYVTTKSGVQGHSYSKKES